MNERAPRPGFWLALSLCALAGGGAILFAPGSSAERERGQAMVVLPAAGGATAAGPVSLSATPAPLAGAQAAGGDTDGAASIWSTPAEFAPPE